MKSFQQYGGRNGWYVYAIFSFSTNIDGNSHRIKHILNIYYICIGKYKDFVFMNHNGKGQPYHRCSIRLKGYNYSWPGYYFVTICTKGRECLFGCIKQNQMCLNSVGELVDRCWRDIPQHFCQVKVREYIIMPNHIHGIIEILPSPVGANNHSPLRTPLLQSGTSKTIGSVIRGFKIGVTLQMGYSPWQRNYYEHIIRTRESYARIVKYMDENPIRWGNCQCGGRGE